MDLETKNLSDLKFLGCPAHSLINRSTELSWLRMCEAGFGHKLTRGFNYAGVHLPDCDSAITRTYIHDPFMKYQIHRYSVAGIARSVQLLGYVRVAEGPQLDYRHGQGSLGTARPSVRYTPGGAVGTARPSVRYAAGGVSTEIKRSLREIYHSV